MSTLVIVQRTEKAMTVRDLSPEISQAQRIKYLRQTRRKKAYPVRMV